MSYAHALPRIRVRRRRPPSGWILWGRIYMVVCLNQIAYATIELGRGDWIAAVVAPIWIFLYIRQRQWVGYRRKLEEVHDIPMRPPSKWLWLLTAVLVWNCLQEWFLFPL